MQTIGRLFKPPTPPEAPPIPTTQSAPVQQASTEATVRRSRSAGFRSTLISKPDSTLGKIGGQLGGQTLKDTIGA